MNIREELLGVVKAFDVANIEYAICGGLAVAIHGFPRGTKDIDVLIQETDLDRAKRAAETVGFDIESGLIRFRTGQPDEERMFRVVKVDGSEMLVLDLILVTPPLAEVWSKRATLQVGEFSITTVSKEGLIAMKRSAGRPIDLRDIELLERPS
jgi:hypothetical protein